MKIHDFTFSKILLSLLVWLAIGITTANAASVGLKDVPLYAMKAVEPNIYLSMDDSGSMYWSFMPDGIYGNVGTHRAKSSAYNKMYYDPNINYTPAVDEGGISLGRATFNAAWNDGFHQGTVGECTVDLSTSFRPTWYYGDHCDGNDSTNEYAGPAEPAYYYLYDGVGSIDDDASYTKVVVGATSGPGVSDERQNFANWYSYYRKRVYTSKSAATRAFSNLGTAMRTAHQTINAGGVNNLSTLEAFSGASRANFFTWLNNVPASGGTPLVPAINRVGIELSSSDDPYREDPSNSSTTALSCRQNFHIMMTDGYWNSGTGIGGNQDTSNHTVPSNDYGIATYSAMAPYRDANVDYVADTAFYYWITDLRPGLNNDVPTNVVDLSTDTNGDGTVDDFDVFWNPINDPARWQHMVTYTIGLGVDGTLNFPADYPQLLSGAVTWGADHIDDLWHAAMNSRGSYFSAGNPQELVDSFNALLKSVTDTIATAAPVSLNSGSISSETRLFQVKFDTGDWTGEVLSLPIFDGTTTTGTTCTAANTIGSICAPEWEASCKLDGGVCAVTGSTEIAVDWNTGRSIITFNPDSDQGVPFRWAATPGNTTITAVQENYLNRHGSDNLGSDRLEFLRGNKSLESANGCANCVFRDRSSLLGDIVNSNPLYVGEPSRFYPDTLEAISYSSFRTAKANRTKMVYIGANDGMLHGIDSRTGLEKIAFVPNAVYPNLYKLANINYAHTNFVDGKQDSGDVFYGAAWHTVLVGGLGLGGQAVYALDITDPSVFTEANASNLVLWEFSDSDDLDMGYTYGKPIIRKLNTGEWAAIFGNGYDSTQADGLVSPHGYAAVYIVNIETGALIKKIPINKGVSEDPTLASRPNGLTTIQAVDRDRDFMADYLYAGDLFGNVWRINIDSNNTANWELAFGGQPLYVAKDSLGTEQPITTITPVGSHPTRTGVMVYFGTGKYLGLADVTDTSPQTFYAVWDRWFDGDLDTSLNEADFPTTPLTRSDLLEQEILGANTSQFTAADGSVNEARVTTNHMIDWSNHSGWYLDLIESGERVHQDSFLRSGRIIFVTVTPSDNPCLSGGSSWLMELDASNGSRLDLSPFDYNTDGTFDAHDQVNFDVDGDGTIDVVGGSGIHRDITGGGGGGGIYTTPAVLTIPKDDNERKYMATSSGSIESIGEATGRRLKRSWREIMH